MDSEYKAFLSGNIPIEGIIKQIRLITGDLHLKDSNFVRNGTPAETPKSSRHQPRECEEFRNSHDDVGVGSSYLRYSNRGVVKAAL